MRARIRCHPSPTSVFHIETMGTDGAFYTFYKIGNDIILFGMEILQGNVWHEKEIDRLPIQPKAIELTISTIAKAHNIYLQPGTINTFAKILIENEKRGAISGTKNAIGPIHLFEKDIQKYAQGLIQALKDQKANLESTEVKQLIAEKVKAFVDNLQKQLPDTKPKPSFIKIARAAFKRFIENS